MHDHCRQTTRRPKPPGPSSLSHPVPRLAEPAHMSSSDDAEAIAIAEAPRLDQFLSRRLGARPRADLARCRTRCSTRRAGCGRSTCRKPTGVRSLSYVTIDKVIQIISVADPSIGQITQNHIGVVAAIRDQFRAWPRRRCCSPRCLKGTRFGNAFSEFGSRRAAEFDTKFTDAGDHVDRQRQEVLFQRRAAGASRADRGASMTRGAPGTPSRSAARRASA